VQLVVQNIPLMLEPPPLEPALTQIPLVPHWPSPPSGSQAFEQNPPGQLTLPNDSVKHSASLGSVHSAFELHGAPTERSPVVPASPASDALAASALASAPPTGPGRRSSPQPQSHTQSPT
jgi:hypothetical protein